MQVSSGIQEHPVLLWVILIAGVVLCLEGIAYGGLWWLDRYRELRYEPTHTLGLTARHRRSLEDLLAGQTRYIDFSPVLGWTIKPNAADGIYQSNSMGIRANREFSNRPSEDIVRVCTFGDSYTHGEEVAYSATWQAQMSSLRPELEVLNFGVGGFGLDQAYLRYRKLDDGFACDLVFIGFMSENINRVVSVYRPFYVDRTGMPLTKPRFVLDDDRLLLKPNPMTSLRDYEALLKDPASVLPSLGGYDHYYQAGYAAHFLDTFAVWRLGRVLQRSYRRDPHDRDRVYDSATEAFALTVKLMETFYREAISRGSQPVVVLFADFHDVYDHRHGRAKRYSPLLAALASYDFMHVDASDAFARYGDQYPTGSYFTPRLGHYSELGNQLVARYLVDFLDEHGLTTAPARGQAGSGAMR